MPHPNIRLLLAGLPGVLALALVTPPAVPGVTADALRLAGVVQGLALLLLGIGLGQLGSRRLQLPSLLAGTAGRGALPLLPVLGGGLLVGVALVALGALTGDGPGMPVATRLLYGGVTEEIIIRWGLLGLLLALALRAGMPRAPAAALAVLLASAAFALLHLPALHALLPEASPLLVGAALATNLLGGVVFGLLFLRHSLEAAMLAHAGAHLVALLAG